VWQSRGAPFSGEDRANGLKAFLVAVDREACCRYKALLDEYLPQKEMGELFRHRTANIFF
jgi:hypothetical protein